MELSELRRGLRGFGYTDYLRHLTSVEERVPEGASLRVAIVRSYTIEPIEPVLRLRLLLDGYRPSIWFGGYNQYVQEMLDPQSALYAFRPDIVLMMVRLEEVVPDFVGQFPTRSATEWQQHLLSKAQELAQLAERVTHNASAQVFIQNAVMPAGHFGVFDAQSADGHTQLVHVFNRALAESVAGIRGVFVWDFDAFARAKGLENLLDPKQWYVSRSPFKLAAYPFVGADLHRYLRSALGRVAKCVVVDLDNTLWGGIAGEDGLDGVKLGHTYPGNCYRDFQSELLKLYDRGILLAIDSKNNEDDALRIIDEHPDMLLRSRHFAARRINWEDKASNLRSIARELNIGLDSLIFVDDSPVECERIRQECPECEVVLLPDKPYLLPGEPSTWAGVENIRLTAEDRERGEMYRAQSARKELEERYTNVDDFLRTLEMVVSIEPATPFSIPRIAQLTQKTNQMNMTTRRYTEAQIQGFAGDHACAVYAVSSKDRFGDNGIIGVFILRFAPEECVIDTFLLSCRVIGRGIEDAMVAFIADLARLRGVRHLIGEFFPTAKNRPAAGFYERTGFQPATDNRFRAELHEASLPYPAHVRVSSDVRQPADSA